MEKYWKGLKDKVPDTFVDKIYGYLEKHGSIGAWAAVMAARECESFRLRAEKGENLQPPSERIKDNFEVALNIMKEFPLPLAATNNAGYLTFTAMEVAETASKIIQGDDHGKTFLARCTAKPPPTTCPANESPSESPPPPLPPRPPYVDPLSRIGFWVLKTKIMYDPDTSVFDSIYYTVFPWTKPKK